jgi:hypothetical protein
VAMVWLRSLGCGEGVGLRTLWIYFGGLHRFLENKCLFVLCALFFETLPLESSVCELFSRISSQVAFFRFVRFLCLILTKFIPNSYLLLAFWVRSYYGVCRR